MVCRRAADGWKIGKHEQKELETPEILTEEAAGAAAEAEQEPMETAEAPAAKRIKSCKSMIWWSLAKPRES